MKHLRKNLAVTLAVATIASLSGCSIADPVVQASANTLLQNDSLTMGPEASTPTERDITPPSNTPKGTPPMGDAAEVLPSKNTAQPPNVCDEVKPETVPGVQGMKTKLETLELQLPRDTQQAPEGNDETLLDMHSDSWHELLPCKAVAKATPPPVSPLE